jgi:predicted MFS family arabinose efflux permease
MLIGGIALGLVLGLVLGGRLSNLADVRLRYLPLLFLAVIVRFGTEAALAAGIPIVEQLRVPLFVGAYGLLLVGLWANRSLPGLGIAFVGILANAIAITANGGYMPIWVPSLEFAGFPADEVRSVFHVLLPPVLDAEFLQRAGPLGDIIPIPLPIVRNVASIGDLLLSLGLGFFLFAVVLRSQAEREEDETAAAETRLSGLASSLRLPRTLEDALGRSVGVPTQAPQRSIRAETGLARGLAEAAALERPVILGGPGPGLGSPALAPLAGTDDVAQFRGGGLMAASATGEAVFVPPPPTIAVRRPTVLERARNHPYVRLAIDPSFSALWVGQLISIFGDRVHQIAIGALVLGLTGSYLALALVFVAATIPNLFLAPIAGTYVDRWNPRQVMIVSDLLRAAVVLLIPVAAVIWIPLVYPMVILMTSISVFFRPARVTALPRMVRESDILPANSALWVGETLGDVIGYPIAGIFVYALGSGLPLAFWFDAATYIASGLLIATTTMRTLPRRTNPDEPRPAILEDLKVGWRFLRQEPVLLANTVQGAIGQFGTGIFTAVTYAYAVAITMDADKGKTAFAAIETGIGVGNLVGGFLLGLVAARMARGKLVIVGYTIWGFALIFMGLTASVPFAVGLAFASGVANMIYIIPSQTMFQERVPPELLGRVVGFRFAAVFGALTIAGAVGGVVAQLLSPSAAVLLAGILPLAAGLGGLFTRAVREA